MAINVDINVKAVGAEGVDARQAKGDLPVAAAVLAIVIAWLVAVIVAAASGVLSELHPPLIAALVAAGIAAPTLCYFTSPRLRSLIDRIGHQRIILFHSWRIPAALLFFWYGLQGALPPLFWILAGIGDLIAGTYALRLSFTKSNSAPAQVLRFHRFGFADFVVAVGTGLTFTLLLDPRMAPIATLPLALIPLFGVGISGASHLMAFDMLRRAARS